MLAKGCSEPGAIGQGHPAGTAQLMIPLPRTVLTGRKCPGRFAKWRGLPCRAWVKVAPFIRELELMLTEAGAGYGWMLLWLTATAKDKLG